MLFSSYDENDDHWNGLIEKLIDLPVFSNLTSFDLCGFQVTDFNLDAFKIFADVSYFFIIPLIIIIFLKKNCCLDYKFRLDAQTTDEQRLHFEDAMKNLSDEYKNNGKRVNIFVA